MDDIEKEKFGRCTNCDYPFYNDCLPIHDAQRALDGSLVLIDHYLCSVCANKFMENPEMPLYPVHFRTLTPQQADEFNKRVRKEWLGEDEQDDNPGEKQS